MFRAPARAGMNRVRWSRSRGARHVPRASGDEPARRGISRDDAQCSPRDAKIKRLMRKGK